MQGSLQLHDGHSHPVYTMTSRRWGVQGDSLVSCLLSGVEGTALSVLVAAGALRDMPALWVDPATIQHEKTARCFQSSLHTAVWQS